MSLVDGGKIDLKSPLRYCGRLADEPEKLPWGAGYEIELSGVDYEGAFIPASGGLRLGYVAQTDHPASVALHVGDSVAVLTRAKLPQVLNSAAIAALLLLVAKPSALGDSGFQLSFLAIGCIGGLALPWMEATVQPYARALPGWRGATKDVSCEPGATQFRIDLRLLARAIEIRLPARMATVAESSLVGGIAFSFRVWELSVLTLVLQIGMLPLLASAFHRGEAGGTCDVGGEFRRAARRCVKGWASWQQEFNDAGISGCGSAGNCDHFVRGRQSLWAPSPELLERLEASRARVLRTDRDGAVHILTDGDRLEISCFLACAESATVTSSRHAEAPNQN